MNNPDDMPGKEFVMHRKDEADDEIADYDDQGLKSGVQSYRKRFSMPLIFGAGGFLVLNIIITVLIASSKDSTGGEQIAVIEKRLERIEAELISMAKDIEELRPYKGTSGKQNTSTTKKKGPSTQSKQKSLKLEVYKVQSGDSLSKIGQQYGVSVEQLRKYNNLEPNSIIYPGQELKIAP